MEGITLTHLLKALVVQYLTINLKTELGSYQKYIIGRVERLRLWDQLIFLLKFFSGSYLPFNKVDKYE